MRVPDAILQDSGELTLVEGMMPSEFESLLVEHLQVELGVGDLRDLSRRLKKFGDFNEDGKVRQRRTINVAVIMNK